MKIRVEAGVLLLVLWVLIVGLAWERPSPTPPPAEREAAYTYYFPWVQVPVPDGWGRRGVAWWHQGVPSPFGQADTLQAWWVYHSSGCRYASDRVLPFFRPAYQEECVEYLPSDYAGWLFVGNEGEFVTQDHLTETEMASLIEEARARWPDAQLVCLNSYLIGYMERVMKKLERPCAAWGLHIYHHPEWLPSMRVDAVCEAVHRRWDDTSCQVIISEMGYDYTLPEAYPTMRAWTADALADSRVVIIFIYTAQEGVPDSLNAFGTNGELRSNGLGWLAGSSN